METTSDLGLAEIVLVKVWEYELSDLVVFELEEPTWFRFGYEQLHFWKRSVRRESRLVRAKCVKLKIMYSPYTDTTLYPTYDISTVPDVKCFTLGFIVADGKKNPSWGGYYPISTDFYKDIMAKVRANGGELICSFGGASGAELATVVKNVDDLYCKYKAVIDTYQFNSIDFDIEGPGLSDRDAIDRRAHAILKLLNCYPDLQVSVTLPVMPDGLDDDGLYVVQSTPCDLVNIMAMDYGTIKKGDMGRAACDAATATRKQTGKDIGITPMIGRNDTWESGEIFDQGDAYTVKGFQVKNSWVKRLGCWAIERDRGVMGDLNWSSQIYQDPFEFSEIFK